MGETAEKHQYNVQNLKHDFTPEERSQNGKKGGAASGRTRRAQRTFRDSINAILSCPVQDEEVRKALETLGLDATILSEINMAVIEKAKKGDVEATRFVRDTRGEKPVAGLEIGNLDGKPLASIDLSGMTDDQLRALAAQRAADEELDEG